MTDSRLPSTRHSKIGIFGGTFDPIHIGHIHCAIEAKAALSLDKVIFVPARISPFKLARQTADVRHRFKMCELAISEHENFCVSDLETRREGPSYTIDTIRDYSNGEFSGDSLFFIIGSDAFVTLSGWKESEDLAKIVDFAILMRSDQDVDEVEKTADMLGANIHLVDCNRIDVSSSEIKEILSAGGSIEGLVPDKVLQYIEKEELYRV